MIAPMEMPEKSGLQKWMNASPVVLAFVLSLSAFVIYSCMYGFRKPYTVGVYEHIFFLGISYKVCLVIAQVLGYMVSKFVGIRVIAALNPEKRALYIVVAILVAWLSLLFFAIIPAPFNLIFLFINGLPLGMVFGLVFSFLEGRRTTELMGALLATSFIFASGVAKTVGKWLMLQFNMSEWWMPFAAGGIFILPLLFFVWILQHAPAPNNLDIAHRSVRQPMNHLQRKLFLKQFGWAILPVVIGYSIFTIVRDFCEDFANELWMEVGFSNNANIFSHVSTLVSMLVLVVLALFFLIKNNAIALKRIHYLVIGGVVLAAVSTFLFASHLINPLQWMVAATTGLYLAYLPFNCIYFERFIATFKVVGNVGFLMYIADAFGYLGTVLVLLLKEFLPKDISWIHFFSMMFYVAAIAGGILMLMALIKQQQILKNINTSL